MGLGLCVDLGSMLGVLGLKSGVKLRAGRRLISSLWRVWGCVAMPPPSPRPSFTPSGASVGSDDVAGFVLAVLLVAAWFCKPPGIFILRKRGGSSRPAEVEIVRPIKIK